MADFIQIHPRDTVAVALRDIPAGTEFMGVTAIDPIPQGHKMALVFYTILHIFADFTGISHPLVLGFVELTQGVTALSATPAGFVMAAALLGWGGLSVHCQTAAVLAGTDLSLKNHLFGKSYQALLSALLAVLLLPLLW